MIGNNKNIYTFYMCYYIMSSIIQQNSILSKTETINSSKSVNLKRIKSTTFG